MNTRILVIGAVAASMFANFAAVAQPQITPEVKTNLIGFVQGVSAERNITVSLYPSYAPDLINRDGKSDQWGAGLAVTYHPAGAIGQYTFVGLRADWLGSEIGLASASGGLKADVQLFGVNVTPLVFTSATIPMSGTQQDGNWGAAVGGGAKATVWTGQVFGKPAKLSIFATAEKWTQFDGMIYHPGAALTISW